jgi:hypothetical protein
LGTWTDPEVIVGIISIILTVILGLIGIYLAILTFNTTQKQISKELTHSLSIGRSIYTPSSAIGGVIGTELKVFVGQQPIQGSLSTVIVTCKNTGFLEIDTGATKEEKVKLTFPGNARVVKHVFEPSMNDQSAAVEQESDKFYFALPLLTSEREVRLHMLVQNLKGQPTVGIAIPGVKVIALPTSSTQASDVSVYNPLTNGFASFLSTVLVFTLYQILNPILLDESVSPPDLLRQIFLMVLLALCVAGFHTAFYELQQWRGKPPT